VITRPHPSCTHLGPSEKRPGGLTQGETLHPCMILTSYVPKGKLSPKLTLESHCTQSTYHPTRTRYACRCASQRASPRRRPLVECPTRKRPCLRTSHTPKEAPYPSHMPKGSALPPSTTCHKTFRKTLTGVGLGDTSGVALGGSSSTLWSIPRRSQHLLATGQAEEC
jgi:hypothetical protein